MAVASAAPELLERQLFEISVSEWFIAAGIGIATWIAIALVTHVLTRRLAGMAERSAVSFDDALVVMLQGTNLALVVAVATWAGSTYLTLPAKSETWIARTGGLAILLQAALWVNILIGFYVSRHRAQHVDDDAAAVTTVGAFAFLGRIFVWALILLLALDNMGINVTALVAGLGIGGIAVALALQNILGDLFASLSIVIDKPFVIGDFLVVGDFAGTVEKIGLKTTRLRSLSGEQIVAANGDLLNSRIRNYQRMSERRVVFQIGVTYETSLEKLESIPKILTEVIEETENTRFDRAHLKAYGDFSINFEVVYYVSNRDYNLYMDTHERVNFAIFRRFHAEGISFAYPTRRLLVEGTAVAS